MDKNMIVSNWARCLYCGEAIFSRSTHDFVTCSCGKLSVDGGMEYIRRVGEPADREELSIFLPKIAIKAAVTELKEAEKTNRNELGKVLAVIRALKKSGVDFVIRDEDETDD